MFAIFNELNDDDDYDIICRKHTHISSQIPHRVCKARIYRDTASDLAGDQAFGDTGTDIGNPPPGRVLDDEFHAKIFNEKILSLARQSPEFLRALRKRHERKRALELELKRRRK